MANIQTTAVGKIIEGALSGDLKKVKAYAEHIAIQLEKQGELRASNIIRNKLNQVKEDVIVVLDSELNKTIDIIQKATELLGMTDKELEEMYSEEDLCQGECVCCQFQNNCEEQVIKEHKNRNQLTEEEQTDEVMKGRA